jgi:hypothetical protein
MHTITKHILFFITIYLVPFVSTAQPMADTIQNQGYLFERFIEGQVLLKSGAVEPAALNYDANKQGIVFLKNGTHFELTGLETIDTVYVNQKKFVPVKAVFYEVTATTPIELYTTYTCKTVPVTETAEHSGGVRKSRREVSNTISDVYMNRPFRGDYAVEFRKHFWIRNYHEFYKVNSEKQVIKQFPQKEAAIKAFVKTNHTDFDKPDDLLKLLQFCNE